MIRGIGVDTASIKAIERFLESEEMGPAFKKKTFTEGENKAAETRHDTAEYYATRFAAKEAVFKAVGHLLPSHSFDFRIVETLNGEDGCPYVNITEELAPILEEAEVTTLHISSTTEDDYATAFVVAEG